MPPMRMIGVFLALAAHAQAALAEADLSAEAGLFSQIDAGILCVAEGGERVPAPDTRLGFIVQVAGDITLGLAARRVPAIAGLSFGVIATVTDGQGLDSVTMTVTHPPMGASASTRDTWSRDFPGGSANASFFRFDIPEELVPGNWAMQAVAGTRVLYTARFQVVDPAAMPDFIDPCDPQPQLS